VLIRFVRSRPFFTLALFTLAVGVVWHLSGLDSDEGALGSSAFVISYVLGLPFILAMRLVGTVVSNPMLRGVLALTLGLLPYFAADGLLRRRRAHRQGDVSRAT
jgi:hypothetical protein